VEQTRRIDPGSSGTVAVTTAGKIALVLFSASVGQRVSITTAGSQNVTADVSIIAPDGSLMWGIAPAYGGNTFTEPISIMQSGTHTFVLDPQGTTTNSWTVSVYEVPPDASATVAPGDPAVTLSTTVPGQNAKVLFVGSAGQRISVTSSGVQNNTALVSLVAPDGTTVWGPGNFYGGNGFTDVVVLAQAGTHTFLLDEGGAETNTWTVRVYAVPADASATVTPGDPAVTLSTTVPGQNAKVIFNATNGQKISVTSSGTQNNTAVVSVTTGNTTVWGPGNFYGGNGFTDVIAMTQTATYTFLLDEGGAETNTWTVRVYDVPADASGSLVIGGPQLTLTVSVPGQNASATFDGSAGQQLNLTYGGGVGSFMSVLNPDSSVNWSGNMYGSGVVPFSLTQTGTHNIRIDVGGAQTGDITLLLALSGGAAPRSEIALASGSAGALQSHLAAPLFDGDRPVKVADEHGDTWTPDPADLRGWSTGRVLPPERTIAPLRAAAGITALSGQVLALNGRVLSGVTLAIEGASTQTDDDGRFLLAPVGAGHAELLVNGTATGRRDQSYGMFEIGVELAEGRTTLLPFTIWLPRIDTAHAVAISSPTTTETVITTPHIPGLELHLPAGSVVKDMAGSVVTEISLTAIPIDRPPFPLPKFENIPIYFTAQPGCAYVLPDGAQIWYPNYTNLAPATRVNLWNYEPDGGGWRVYGHGTVTENGQQIRPDADAVIYEFTGAMFSTIFNPPAWWAAVGDFFAGGDPVDLGSGLFVMDHTDLALPDVTPIALARTYRQADTNNRGWGAGWSHPYFSYLWSANQYQEVDLILPDGGRVHYVRTSPGTGWADAVFEHTGTPSAFYQSHIVWNGNGWDLTLKDGTKLVFLENGPLVLIVDRYGNRTSLLRLGSDPKGNIDVIRSPNGRWIQLTYDTFNRITRAEDNSGRAVTYDYTAPDATGKLWKVHDAAGGITEYGYDANGRLRTIKDAKLISYLTVDYDASGRVQTQTQADSTTFQFAYTVVSGKVTQTDVTDPRSFIRRVTFNTAGYGVTDTAALGQSIAQTVSYERDPASNLVLSVTDPRGRVTRNAYYPSGDLWTTTSLYGTADAVTTTFTYEPKYGQLASVTDPLNHSTSFGFDASFNATSETDALQHATTFSYYPSGQLQTTTNALQKTTTFVYEAGDLLTLTDPLGRVTKRFSDAIGRSLAVTDSLGNRTRFEYDSLNQVSKVTDPSGNATQFTYDPNGNRLTVKDAKNNVTTYTYDNTMNRLATRKDALNKTETYNSYDPNGNLLVVTDRKGQVIEYRYDALNRQSFAGFGRTGTSPNFSYQSTINYTYDNGNRLYQGVDSVSGTVTRGYDELDRLTSEVTAQGTLGYQYDTASRRTQLTVTGQTAVTYGYDNADRLLSITQGATSVGLGYDSADRRTSLTLPGNLSIDYGYDDASQLLALTYKRSGSTIGDLAYTYDASGRRATTSGSYARLNLPTALSSALYNANNQLTKWGNTNITYDLNGNMNGDGTNSYSWNARDQLSAVTKSGQTLPSFTYDAFGRRQKKTLGAVVTSYLYDGANTVQELTGASPSANLLAGLGMDELFQRTEGGTTRTFLADALGSVVALADSAGVVQTSYTYAPYGATTVTGAASNNPSKFTGREDDADGLYFYRARYYHPVMSRFVSEDPIGFGGGDPDLYRYAAGSPSNYTDPIGNCAVIAAVSAAFTISAFVLAGRKTEHTIGDWLWLGFDIAMDVACVGIVGKLRNIVIIGETQGRVGVLSKIIGGTRATMPKVIGDTAAKLAANTKWINEAIDKGRVIVDLGRDPAAVARGEPIHRYYRLEQDAINARAYGNIVTWPLSGFGRQLGAFMKILRR
jgi:RHS repeat-associated protein